MLSFFVLAATLALNQAQASSPARLFIPAIEAPLLLLVFREAGIIYFEGVFVHVLRKVYAALRAEVFPETPLRTELQGNCPYSRLRVRDCRGLPLK